jgi:tetratricopeptide (TPR) repeat protein
MRMRFVSLLAGMGLAGASCFGATIDRSSPGGINNGKVVPIDDVAPELRGKTANKDKPKTDAEANARAAKFHIANLSDKDPEVRQTSAWMLGTLGSIESVPFLIEALKDAHIMVQINAHGALNKITGKNFGYKNYGQWKSWWESSKEDFLKKQKLGPNEMNKFRAKNSNTMGLQYLKEKQFAQAYSTFLDAVNQDPEIPDYRNNLGLSVMEMGRFIEAIGYFEETIGLDDALPQPYMNIGNCYGRMGRHIEAQNWIRRAMNKDKEGAFWETCWSLGKEFLNKGDFTMAQEFLDQARIKAERVRTFDPRIYRDLALAHYGLDQFNSSWKELQNLKTLGYDPDPDFEAKVKAALKEQGTDVDKFETERKDELRRQAEDAATK